MQEASTGFTSLSFHLSIQHIKAHHRLAGFDPTGEGTVKEGVGILSGCQGDDDVAMVTR